MPNPERLPQALVEARRGDHSPTQPDSQVALPLMCAIRLISKQLTMVDPSVWEQG